MYRLPPLQPNVWKAKPAFLGYFIVLHSEMLSALDSLRDIAAHREVCTLRSGHPTVRGRQRSSGLRVACRGPLMNPFGPIAVFS